MTMKVIDPSSLKNKAVALGVRSNPLACELLKSLDQTCAEIVLLPSEKLDDESFILANVTPKTVLITDCEKLTHLLSHVADVICMKEQVSSILLDFSSKSLACDHDSSHKSLLNTKFTLFTSGTSGEPKRIEHPRSFLIKKRPAETHKDHVARWALLYRVERFAGLQVFMHCCESQEELFAPNLDVALTDIVTQLQVANVNAISCTPSFCRRLMMAQGFGSLKLKQITLGGEIADQAILSQLTKQFPQARITHIYASTEVGYGFSISDKLAGFPRQFLDDQSRQIQFRINPETNELEIKKEGYHTTFISTGDRVAVEEDRIHFLGRESNQINVGGAKVQPEEIEYVLLGIKNVIAAKVYPRKSSMLGAMIAAKIVHRDWLDNENNMTKDPMFETALRSEIISICRKTLPAYKVPAFIDFVSDLTLNETGKISRRDP